MSKKSFNISTELYSVDSLNASMSAFSDYRIQLSDQNEITIDDEDPEFIFDEFMNYTLAYSLEQVLGA